MYDKVETSLNFAKREEEILAFWKDEKIFEAQEALRKEGDVFTFYDGPPTANGKPHIGHILTRAIKDLIPRHRSMKGQHVLRKAGWDTHGLPVELEVEKALDIDGKEAIEAYGIAPFVHACKHSVWTYKQEWEAMSERVGYWADMEAPYVTYDNDYIESEWWAIQEIDKKGLLYEGYKVVPYCPRCGTSLASHEVAQGYKEVEETSVYVRFPVEGKPDHYLAAWTTTPWTLPSNTALCVNPALSYLLIQREEEGRPVFYYVAEALAEEVFGADFVTVERMKGAALAGLRYTPLFPYAKALIEESKKEAYFVTVDDFVTVSDGTGLVHIAPAFGEDDAQIGMREGLPLLRLVQEDGTMSPEVTDFAGQFCKDADAGILAKLEADGLLIKAKDFSHSYPFCWRCDTPLIYYARDSWFIRMTALREQLIARNKEINWLPPSIGTGRFGHFLEGVVDWTISRQRYWGMPLPIWRCACGKTEVIGSIAELKERSDNCPEEIELHRPFVDQVTMPCKDCAGTMTRVPDVIDCWFDSGAMPFAQWHYPFENKELFEKYFPAQFISEATDQTRGWFYSLLALSTLLFDKPAYENCLVLGFVLDEKGHKMSKHKGNVVDPWEIMDQEGADAVRWYFYTNSHPWLPSSFSMAAVNEMKRRFMGTFWNSYAFYVLYAKIDQFNPSEHHLQVEKLSLMDRWILSRLHSLIQQVDDALERYDITPAARAMEAFVDELSNWYVRRGRERYWQAGMEEDKVHAYLVLYEVLVNLAKLAAPFTPFMAEMIYQNLVPGKIEGAPRSIHLCDYPKADTTLIDKALEEEMSLVLKLLALGRTARASSGLKTRQPLAKMLVVGSELPSEEALALLQDELNVKAIEISEDGLALQDYVFKPELRRLGKRFGKELNALRAVLAALDGPKAYQRLEEEGALLLDLAGRDIRLEREELLVEVLQHPDYASASDAKVTVALDTRLTDTLRDEGLLREMVSKIQSMRREADYELTDRIKIYLGDSPSLAALAKAHETKLLEAVLGEGLYAMTDLDASAEAARQTWRINKEDLAIALVPVKGGAGHA